jgi:predicted DNA-binding transcriptional regulator YafY
MPRSTQADKARQLNVAHRLLTRNVALPEAAQRLARQFGLSLRQAYRYLEAAAELDAPVEVAEATIPVTLKLPPPTVRALRAYARSSGLTIGAIVSRALDAFLGALRKHG